MNESRDLKQVVDQLIRRVDAQEREISDLKVLRTVFAREHNSLLLGSVAFNFINACIERVFPSSLHRLRHEITTLSALDEAARTDTEAAERWSALQEELAKAGFSIGDFDVTLSSLKKIRKEIAHPITSFSALPTADKARLTRTKNPGKKKKKSGEGKGKAIARELAKAEARRKREVDDLKLIVEQIFAGDHSFSVPNAKLLIDCLALIRKNTRLLLSND